MFQSKTYTSFTQSKNGSHVAWWCTLQLGWDWNGTAYYTKHPLKSKSSTYSGREDWL